MELKIDSLLIEKAINENISAALTQSLGGYQMTDAVAKIVTAEVANGAVAEAIKVAVEQINKSDLAMTLAQEIQRAVTSAAVAIVREGMVGVVCRLRGVDGYGHEKERAEVRASLLK